MNPEALLKHLFLLRRDDFVRVETLRECIKLLCSEPDKLKKPEPQPTPDKIEVGDEVCYPNGDIRVIASLGREMAILQSADRSSVLEEAWATVGLKVLRRPALQVGDFVRVRSTGITGLVGSIQNDKHAYEIWRIGLLGWYNRSDLELLRRP